MKKTYILSGIAALIIVVALGGWYSFSNPQIAAAFGIHKPGPKSGMASSTAMRGMMRGGFATGSIGILNGDGFTLTLQDGSTKNVTLTSTTTIQYFANASSTPATITSDQLSVGEQVSVMGTPNTDGSTITAMRVMAGTLPNLGSFGDMHGGMASSTWQGGRGGGMGRPGGPNGHASSSSAMQGMPMHPAQ